MKKQLISLAMGCLIIGVPQILNGQKQTNNTVANNSNEKQALDFNNVTVQMDSMLLNVKYWVATSRIDKEDYDSLRNSYNIIFNKIESFKSKIQTDWQAVSSSEKKLNAFERDVKDWRAGIEKNYSPYRDDIKSQIENDFVPLYTRIQKRTGEKWVNLFVQAAEAIWGWFEKLYFWIKKEVADTKQKKEERRNALVAEYSKSIQGLTENMKLSPFDAVVGSYIPKPQVSQLPEVLRENNLRPIITALPVNIAPISSKDSTFLSDYSTVHQSRYTYSPTKSATFKDGVIITEIMESNYLNIYRSVIHKVKYKNPGKSSKIDFKANIGTSESLFNGRSVFWNVTYSELNKSQFQGNYLYLKENADKSCSVCYGQKKIDSKFAFPELCQNIKDKSFIKEEFHQFTIVNNNGNSAIYIDNNFVALAPTMNAMNEDACILFSNISPNPETKEKKDRTKPLSVKTIDVTTVETELLEVDGFSEVNDKGIGTATFRYLVVGISNYRDSDFNLQFADKDAQTVAAMFNSNPNIKKEVVLLQNNAATKQNILTSLEDMVKRSKENDFIYVYFSGHGVDKGLVPHDFKRENSASTIVYYNDLVQILNSKKMKARVMLIDACHSGSLMGSLLSSAKSLDATAYDYFISELNQNTKNSFAAVCSSSASQKSFEDTKLKHGTFTYWLLRALYKGEADNAGDRNNIVTLRELYHYLNQTVTETTKSQKIQVFGKRVKGKTPIAVTN